MDGAQNAKKKIVSEIVTSDDYPCAALSDPEAMYASRLAQVERGISTATSRLNRLTFGLVVTGCAWVLLAVSRARFGAYVLWGTPLLVAAAVLISHRMGRVQLHITRLRRLRTFYESGLARLDHRWMGNGHTGEEYGDEHHPYAGDLDLFGEGSLFELLAVTRTGFGRAVLADCLKTPAGREEALARQEAVAELRAQLRLREEIQLAGVCTLSTCEAETFRKWLDSPDSRFPVWARIAAAVLPPLWVVPAIGGWIGAVPTYTALSVMAAVFLVEGTLAWCFRKRVRLVLDAIGMPAVDLKTVSDLLHLLYKHPFTSPRLRQLPVELHSPDARREIRRLQRRFKFLAWRENVIFTVLSWALLWGMQFSMAIESWRKRHVQDMRRWIVAIGEFEALAAIACYSFEHPHDPFPELTEEGAHLEAQAIGHPLLDERTCQRNDLSLGQPTRLLIVSGSNMSGKSTLVRCVGVNVVLAWMGAPVRAHRMLVSSLQICASIGVRDSLLNGKSRFYAEASKVHDTIQQAASRPVLYLIDEILGGTNSHDRRIAVEAVIRALDARGAIGIITSHDLALTQIALEPVLRAGNVHFSDVGDSGGLEFDYKLRPGVLKHSNALALIRVLGIPV